MAKISLKVLLQRIKLLISIPFIWTRYKYFQWRENRKMKAYTRQFEKLKKDAMALWELQGKQYHIFPQRNGRMTLVTNEDIKVHNKFVSKYGGHKIDIRDKSNKPYFSTPAGKRVRTN